MCGICACLSEHYVATGQVLRQTKMLNHRGPDFCGLANHKDHYVVGHTRLAIVSPNSGIQPIYNPQTNSVLAVNGEIYNYKYLLEHKCSHYIPVTGSDCESLMLMFNDLMNFNPDLFNHISGMFAFVLIDKKNDKFLIARDPMGIIPLYYGYDDQKRLWVASEMKCLDHCTSGNIFPPGSYMLGDKNYGQIVPYYQPRIKLGWEFDYTITNMSTLIKMKLMHEVSSHLMSDVDFGCLLSGGLDSSIIARMTRALMDPEKVLHTFSVGLPGSPDLVAAREMVTYLRQFGPVQHHEIEFTVQQAIDLLHVVIYHIETFDCTTIRASTPLVILSMYARSIGMKMVLSGEGADELFGGYLHFKQAPSPEEFHAECERLVLNLHRKDCLRANKSTMAAGIELRVPFLSTNFVDFIMSIDPIYKMSGENRIEKQILRDACKDLLPESIYKRQKEQFSDGVGYTWVDGVKEHAQQQCSKYTFEQAQIEFPDKTPRTSEEYLYRKIFSELFERDWMVDTVSWEKSISCSSEKAIEWSKDFADRADPSGRSLDHHDGKIKK